MSSNDGENHLGKLIAEGIMQAKGMRLEQEITELGKEQTEGKIQVQYNVPQWYRIADAIRGIFAIGLLVIWGVNRRRGEGR